MAEEELVNKSVCACSWHERKDLGSIGNSDNSFIHIFKCQHHNTIEKFNIKTGEKV